MSGSSSFYQFGRIMLKIIFYTLFRGSIKGTVPRGGVILCSNHLSTYDPPLLSSLSRKPLHFMAKRELFEIPGFSWLIRKLNAFPVNRAFFDRGAFRRAVELVNDGNNIIVFPEGTRNKSGTEKLGPIRRAVSYIIYNTKAPVIPVFISGSRNWLRLGRITLTVGKALDLPERKLDYTREISESICRKIKDGLEKIAP